MAQDRPRAERRPGSRPRRGGAQCITKAGVREAAGGMNVGSDVYSALDRQVQQMIERASERARENGRKTLKARDV